MSLHARGEYSHVPLDADVDNDDHAPTYLSEQSSLHTRRASAMDEGTGETIAYIASAATEAFDHHAHPDTHSLALSSRSVAKENCGPAGTVSPSSRDSIGKGTSDKFGPKPKMWNPPWLQHSVLITFFGTFAAMFATVVILYEVSASDKGLSTQVASRHYAWTYGPTALLTIIASLWRNVDFANKQLAPWQELWHGPSAVEKTLLLDYVSPVLPVYLLQSVRNRHWAVVASTISMLLLKLAIVLSTGLIALEPTLVSNPSGNVFSLTSKFRVDNSSLRNLTGTSGSLYYGISAQGLHYPKGTGPNLVVQDFQPQISLPLDAVYSAQVEGFKSSLDCEIVQIDNSTVHEAGLPWYSVLAPFFLANVTAGNCTIWNAIVAETADHYYHYNPNATQNFQGRVTNVTCSDGIDVSLRPDERPDHTQTHPDNRVLLTMSDLRWLMQPDDVGRQSQSGGSTWWVQSMTAVLCRPSYNLNTYHVEYPLAANISGEPVRAALASNGTAQLSGLSNIQMAYAVITALEKMYIGSGGDDYVLATNVPNFFQLLSAANNNSRQEAFMDPELLRELGSAVWEGVSSQLAYENLMVPSHEVVVGSVSYTENRLQVKLLSTVLMAVVFGLLCCTTAVVMSSRPWSVVPRDPTPVGAIATLLAASPATIEVTRGLGAARGSKIRQALESYDFLSKCPMEMEQSFSVEATRKPRFEELSAKSVKSGTNPDLSWWHPSSTRHWFLCLSVILPVTVIATLEVLQRVSDGHQGLVAVDPSSTVGSRILSSYLPAVVMSVVATLFGSIQDTAAIFAPYSKLKGGNAPASSITVNLIGKMPLHALLLSARSLDIGHTVSILAIFVASFLTIVASGLYTVSPVAASSAATLNQTDHFDFAQGTLSVSDNDAGAITSLMEWSDLPSPDWTYNELAFNRHGLVGSNRSSGVVSVNIPAYRAKLDCNVVLDNTYSVTIIHQDPNSASGIERYTDMAAFWVNQALSIPCLHEVTNPTNVTWQQHFYVPNDFTPNYVGQATLLQWGGVDSGNGNQSSVIGDGGHYPVYGGLVESPAFDISIGGHSCPSLGITIGSAKLSNRTVGNETEVFVDTNLTFAMCFQKLERVQTKVTFDLPAMSINTTLPPVPDESTVVTMQDPTLGSDIWEWPINNLLISLTNGTRKSTTVVPAPPGGDPGLNNLDPFLVTLAAGKHGIPITDILGDTNASYHRLINASQRLYSEYMAQAFSANMRDTASLENTTYPAQILDIPRWRLRQNRDPKVALQAMLAFLAASALATHFLLDTRRVLPHNPCSIAGVATLLADSRLVTRGVIPEGAEWASDAELRRAGVFKDLKLYLGWEKERRDGEKRFGIFVEPLDSMDQG